MKYVMSYELADDGRSKAPLHFPAHRARFEDFHARGQLLMCGPFTDLEGGALGIFTSREAAEEFIREDPLVLTGVVPAWRVREWNEVLAGA